MTTVESLISVISELGNLYSRQKTWPATSSGGWELVEVNKIMNSEINCVHSAEVISYMRARGFPPETVFEGMIDNPDYLTEEEGGRILPVTLAYLRNHRNWISYELQLHMLKNVAGLIGGERPVFRVAKTIYSAKVSGRLGWLIRLLAIHPEWFATKAIDFSRRFTKSKKIAFEDFNKDTGMRVCVRYADRTVTRNALICDLNEGGFVGFSSIFAKNVRSSKVSCACDGDECCEYVLSWEKRSLPETLFRSVSPGFQLIQDDIESPGFAGEQDARIP